MRSKKSYGVEVWLMFCLSDWILKWKQDVLWFDGNWEGIWRRSVLVRENFVENEKAFFFPANFRLRFDNFGFTFAFMKVENIDWGYGHGLTVSADWRFITSNNNNTLRNCILWIKLKLKIVFVMLINNIRSLTNSCNKFFYLTTPIFYVNAGKCGLNAPPHMSSS